jgi:hypothetical protein
MTAMSDIKREFRRRCLRDIDSTARKVAGQHALTAIAINQRNAEITPDPQRQLETQVPAKNTEEATSRMVSARGAQDHGIMCRLYLCGDVRY